MIADNLTSNLTSLVSRYETQLEKFKDIATKKDSAENNAFGLAVGSGILAIPTIGTGMLLGQLLMKDPLMGAYIGAAIPSLMAGGAGLLAIMYKKYENQLIENPNISNELKTQHNIKEGKNFLNKIEDLNIEGFDKVKRVVENSFNHVNGNPTKEIKKIINNKP